MVSDSGATWASVPTMFVSIPTIGSEKAEITQTHLTRGRFTRASTSRRLRITDLNVCRLSLKRQIETRPFGKSNPPPTMSSSQRYACFELNIAADSGEKSSETVDLSASSKSGLIRWRVSCTHTRQCMLSSNVYTRSTAAVLGGTRSSLSSAHSHTVGGISVGRTPCLSEATRAQNSAHEANPSASALQRSSSRGSVAPTRKPWTRAENIASRRPTPAPMATKKTSTLTTSQLHGARVSAKVAA